jgi:exodeoxyribonuclease VIII
MTGLDDGWHEVDMSDYLSWPLWSSSLIGRWKTRTPRYMKWLRDNHQESEPTAASTLGSLTHTAILEPDLLDVLYVCEPEPDPEIFTTASGKPSSNPRATKGFKDAVAELEATGKTVVSHAAMKAAKEMRDAIQHHSAARTLLGAEGPVELSGIWTDPETGVRCRIRPDKLVPAIGANVNIKTSQNPNADAWVHDLWKFGYFRDFAFYERGLKALGFDHRKALALVIETTGPLDDRVAIHEIDEGAMDAGQQLVDKYLHEIAKCEESGVWPGHPQDIRSISLPHYAWTRVDEEISG